jgi:hypothetical protein
MDRRKCVYVQHAALLEDCISLEEFHRQSTVVSVGIDQIDYREVVYDLGDSQSFFYYDPMPVEGPMTSERTYESELLTSWYGKGYKSILGFAIVK